MAEQKLLSWNPDDAIQGGLVSDVDVTFKECRFEYWNYGGRIDNDVAALRITLLVDGQTDTVDQYWSVGDAGFYQPVNDGRAMVGKDGHENYIKNSNFMLLINSLVNQGYERKKGGLGDISILDGVRAHVVRHTAPKREGLDTQGTNEREKMVLIVTKLISVPGEKARAKGKTTTAAAATAAQPVAQAAGEAGAEENELSTLAKGALLIILKAQETVTKGKVKLPLFKQMTSRTSDERNEAVKMVTDDVWLLENGFDIDGENIRLAA